VAKKVFIAATGQHTGKTTISLSLLHMARKKYDRVGFMKPLGPKLAKFNGRDVDMDAKLMARVYGLEEDIELMSPVVLHPGDTKRVLDGYIRPESLLERIKESCRKLEEKVDFLVIEGAGHSGVGSVAGISNAVIAKMVDAPVMMVSGAGIGSAVDDVCLNLALFNAEGADVKLVLPNKIIKEKRDIVLHYLKRAFSTRNIEVLGGFNYSQILANPTLLNISRMLKLELEADSPQASRIVHHIQLGAASTQRVVDLLQPSSLLVVTSSRDELLVMLSTLYHMPEYFEKISGMVVTGVAPISAITQKIMDDSKIPYLRCEERTTAEIFLTLENYVSKITAEDEEKINLVQSLAETSLDFEAIDQLL
jgi:BioD-like phosphotransacetylase family protein